MSDLNVSISGLLLDHGYFVTITNNRGFIVIKRGIHDLKTLAEEIHEQCEKNWSGLFVVDQCLVVDKKTSDRLRYYLQKLVTKTLAENGREMIRNVFNKTQSASGLEQTFQFSGDFGKKVSISSLRPDLDLFNVCLNPNCPCRNGLGMLIA